MPLTGRKKECVYQAHHLGHLGSLLGMNRDADRFSRPPTRGNWCPIGLDSDLESFSRRPPLRQHGTHLLRRAHDPAEEDDQLAFSVLLYAHTASPLRWVAGDLETASRRRPGQHTVLRLPRRTGRMRDRDKHHRTALLVRLRARLHRHITRQRRGRRLGHRPSVRLQLRAHTLRQLTKRLPIQLELRLPCFRQPKPPSAQSENASADDDEDSRHDGQPTNQTARL